MALKVYDFTCSAGHLFEAWLANPDEDVREGRVACPVCGSTALERRPSASRIARVEGTVRTDVAEDLAKRREVAGRAMAAVRQLVDKAEDVGRRFPQTVRSMALGDEPHRLVKGQCSAQEAMELLEEGIAVAPVPDILQHDN